MMNSTTVERSRFRVHRTLLALSTILASGVAAPALAQTAPLFRNVDDNGVDLTLGDYTLNFQEGQIGSGQAALPIIREIQGTQSSQWDRWLFHRSVSGTTATTFISLPGHDVDEFVGSTSASTLSSVKGNGATLTGGITGGTMTYTAADGTKVVFTNPIGTDGAATNFCATANTTNCWLLATSITAPNGAVTTLSWGLHGGSVTYQWRLVSITNSFGYSIGFTYQSNLPLAPLAQWISRTKTSFYNNNVSTTTPQATISYTYPVAGTTDITDMAGNVWEITDTSIKRPGETSPGFSIGGSVAAVTSVTNSGVTTNYHLTTSGTTGTMVVTDPAGNTTTVVSDLNVGRPTSITDALSKTTSYTYSSTGLLTRITYPEGNFVNYTLDSRGNVTQTLWHAKPSSTLTDITTSASYVTTCTNAVSCNRPTSTTDALNHTTNYVYDPTSGLVASVTAPAASIGTTRPQTRYSYGAPVGGATLLTGVSTCSSGDTNSPSCVGTTAETKTTIGYDSNGNANSITTAAGDNSVSSTTTASYTAMGDILAVDGPLSGTDDTTTYRYDAARRPVGVISPDPDGAGPLKRRAVKNTYSPAGLVTETELGTVTGTTDADWAAFASLQQVTTSYDANMRKSKDMRAAGGATYGVTQYSYDPAGRLDCVAVRTDPTQWTGQAVVCTPQTTGASGPDRVSRVTLYDALNRAKQVTTAYGTSDASVEKTEWTDNGKTTQVTDAENNTTSYVYDGFDRLSQTRYPSPTKGSGTSSTTDFEQLGYDANSNVTSLRLRDGTNVGYAYDNLNRPTTKTLPGSELAVTFSYDLLSRPISGATTAQTLTFTYDALGRNLTQAGPQGTVTAVYDTEGRRTRLTYPGGTFYVTYSYQVTNEMTAINENGTTSLATFSYDDLGRRTSLTRGNGVVTSYGYDAVSRLSSQGIDASGTGDDLSLAFSYNPANQIVSTTRSNDTYAWAGSIDADRTYTSNGLNQYSAAGATAFAFDARGNLTTSGSNSYTYSSENMLLTGPSSASLIYDPLLRLYQTSATGFAVTLFDYDGQNLIEERNGSNTLQKRYVFGPADDEPLVEYDAAGNKTWLVADERNSIIARTNSSGTVTSKSSYDEFGIPASGNVGRFGYTGQAWLPEIGMSYYKARIYSPTLGRFMQTDPIGYGDGLNWYNYAGNDPVNFNDPSGLCPTSDDGKDIVICGSNPLGGGPIGGVTGRYAGRVADSGGDVVVTATRNQTAQGRKLPPAGEGPPMPRDIQPDKPLGDVPLVDIVITAPFGGPVLEGGFDLAETGVAAARSAEPDIVVIASRSSNWFSRFFGRIGRLFGRSPCFAAGTLVQTNHGLRRIETIKPGDMVLSRDEKTGRTAYKRVTAVKTPTRDELYTVELDIPAGSKSEHHADFKATATHPWRTVDGRWISTAQLRRGMKLMRSDGGAAEVEWVRDSGRKGLTYNLTVQGYHTYFVGKDRVWVHNSCITFGHGARHLLGTGLDQVEVEAAITKEIKAITSSGASTGYWWGTVEVDGQSVFYRAFTLSNGTINVGTYTVGAP